MHRRTFLASLTLSLQAQARKPNVILIMTDDHGSGDLGCYGAKDLATPHLDSLARDGLRFTEWYSNAPMCAPSRAGLMTGRHPIRAGVPQNGPELPSSQKTLATLLRAQGYRTALCGKWHLGTPGSHAPQDHGFDEFYGFHAGCVDFYSHRYYWGEPGRVNFHDLYRGRDEIFEDGQYLTERLTAEAGQFIRRNARNPFFLYLAYNAPHYPMHAPQKYMDRFRGLEPERRTYAAMLSAVDDGVGEIRALLRQLQIDRDTLIIFTADNGATTEARAGLGGKPATAGQNRGFRGYKFSLFDGGTHVPAIMTWPGKIPAGKTSSMIGAHYDVAPTVLAAAGLPAMPADHFDGVNLWPHVARGESANRSPLHWFSNKQLAMRKGQWKITIDGFEASGAPDGRKPVTGEDAIFLANLESDPGEKRNMRRQFPDIALQMESEARAWLAGVQKLAPQPD